MALILGVARRLVLLVLLFRSRAHVTREVREVEVRVGAVWNKPGKGSKDSSTNKEKSFDRNMNKGRYAALIDASCYSYGKFVLKQGKTHFHTSRHVNRLLVPICSPCIFALRCRFTCACIYVLRNEVRVRTHT